MQNGRVALDQGRPMSLQLGFIPRLQWMRFLCQIPEDYTRVSIRARPYQDRGVNTHRLANVASFYL